jgi:protein gp37
MAKASELGGCLNCYAARLNARNLPNLKSPTTGQSFARILDSGPRWTGRIELIPSTLHLPLRWKEPRRIFVNSQSDLFHEDLPFEDIDRLMAVMGMAQQHTFKALTKRPEMAVRYYASRTGIVNDAILRGMHRLWLGVSAEDQLTADLRIPPLLTLPAAVRFLSYEPALGPVDIRPFLEANRGQYRIDWVIAGGESGPSARPAHPDWFRSMRDQGEAVGIPFFFKQHGAWIATEPGRGRARFVNLAGEFVTEGDEGAVRVTRVGKAAAGAVLDGKEHRDRP